MEIMSDTTESQQGLPEGETAPQPADDNVPASGTEQTSPEPEKQAEPEPKKTPWFQRRIDDLTREKHEERRQREALEAQLRQRMPEQAPQQRNDMVPMSEVQKLVEQHAATVEFNAACDATYDAGVQKYPDFDEAVQTYSMLGGPPRTFLDAVTALGKDDGAKVFYTLGKDPDEAARVLALPPVKMAMALAKMASAPARAVPVSKAPSPIAPIAGSARGDKDPSDMSTDEYLTWRRKNPRPR